MSTPQPPDLAAIRTLYETWATDLPELDGIDVTSFQLAETVPALLDHIEALQNVIVNYGDRTTYKEANARGLL